MSPGLVSRPAALHRSLLAISVQSTTNLNLPLKRRSKILIRVDDFNLRSLPMWPRYCSGRRVTHPLPGHLLPGL